MTAHLFGGLGMMPFGIETDPGLPNFMQRAQAEIPGLVLHGPYRDYNTGQVAAIADTLPADDIVFYVGTSLSANDGFIIAGYAKRKFDGVFMFQASTYGPHSVAPTNVVFAHEIYSYVPIPAPFIGSYIPGPGHLKIIDQAEDDESGYPLTGVFVTTNIELAHPGDYDLPSQMRFINDQKRIIAARAAAA